jgi:hypothetical protein
VSTAGTTFDRPPLDAKAIARDEARELLGQVMGYVAVTVGFAALGAYLGRDLSGATMPTPATIQIRTAAGKARLVRTRPRTFYGDLARR